MEAHVSSMENSGPPHAEDLDQDPLDALWSRAARLAARLLESPAVLIVAPGRVDRRVRAFPRAVDGSAADPLRAMHDLARQVAESGAAVWLDEVVRTGQGEGGAAAFAGVPLRHGGGMAGALCVADTRERRWTAADQTALHDLAELLSAQIETQRDAYERQSAHEQLREIADGFAAVIEACPLGIVAINREGRVELWSPAAERMFGWTQDEVLRQPPPMVPEHERDAASGLRARALAGERMTGMEVRRVRKDGAAIDVSFSTAPLTTRSGEVYGSIVVLENITERRKAEERLRTLETAGRVIGGLFEIEDRLESLARLTVPALGDLCVIDLLQDDGTLTRVRAVHVDAAQEALLRVPDAAVGDGLLSRVIGGEALLAPDPADEELRLLARGPDGDGIRRLGVRSLISVPLHGRGRTLGVLTLASAESGRRYGEDDFSLAKEMAGRAALLLDNSRLYREARQSARAREEILAVVSHELRNPLQAITVLVDTLLQWLPPEAWRDRERRQLASVLNVSRQMSRLVQDLLDVTQMEAGHFSVRADHERVGGIVDEALEMLRPIAEREHVRLEVRMPDGAGAVLADRQRVVQVISNLVGNAIRVSPSGGTVILDAEVSGGEAVFRVTDAGPGVPEDHLPHLFKRFWRPDRAGGLGAGLGLAIARGIVEAHGGHIGVDTSQRGSTFWFTLPASGASEERGAEEAYDAVVLLPRRESTPQSVAERSHDQAAREQAAAERQARFNEGVGRDGGAGPGNDADLLARLRDQIANGIHLGHIEPGDRLPSIRDLSRRFGVTTYAAVHAYEALAAEGLVEKRGRSGMYVAAQDSFVEGLLGETALWLVDVLAGAWDHQIKVPHIPDLVRRWTAAVRLRAACVESDGDTLTALCADVANHFGMDSRPLRPEELAHAAANSRGAARQDPVDALRDTDLLITTAYHAPEVRRLAEALGKPMLVAGVNPEHSRAVEDHLRDRELTVVCTDARFGDRVRAMRGGRYASRVRVVLAGDAAALAALDTTDSVLLTRAAHERLDGAELRPLVPLSPFISPACARSLAQLLVRCNVEARRL